MIGLVLCSSSTARKAAVIWLVKPTGLTFGASAGSADMPDAEQINSTERSKTCYCVIRKLKTRTTGRNEEVRTKSSSTTPDLFRVGEVQSSGTI